MLKTEMRNPNTMHIDRISTENMVSLIQQENRRIFTAVEDAAPQIAAVVDLIAAAMERGNRTYFIGAGTSGRLGVMNAAECPPTFGVEPDVVCGIIAGGERCLIRAGENEEDKEENGRLAVADRVDPGDVVVGISAAGGAAYVIGALKQAKENGAVTVALTCNENTPMEQESDYAIITDTGAEAVTGSTRMKAGTAHKMVLDLLTTCAMIKTGKVYENLMIHVKPSNVKLRRRVIAIVQELFPVDEETAIRWLTENDWDIKSVIASRKGE